MGSFFQLGGPSGPALKNNAGSIDARNSGDSAYINVRGLDPAIADDLVTKRYGDANYGGGGSGHTGAAVLDFGASPGSDRATLVVVGQTGIPEPFTQTPRVFPLRANAPPSAPSPPPLRTQSSALERGSVRITSAVPPPPASMTVTSSSPQSKQSVVLQRSAAGPAPIATVRLSTSSPLEIPLDLPVRGMWLSYASPPHAPLFLDSAAIAPPPPVVVVSGSPVLRPGTTVTRGADSPTPPPVVKVTGDPVNKPLAVLIRPAKKSSS